MRAKGVFEHVPILMESTVRTCTCIQN